MIKQEKIYLEIPNPHYIFKVLESVTFTLRNHIKAYYEKPFLSCN